MPRSHRPQFCFEYLNPVSQACNSSTEDDSEQRPVPWTVGIELEFLYARVRDVATESSFSQWHYYLDELQQLLSQGDLDCKVHPYPDVPLDYTRWNITTDSSIGSSRLERGEEDLLGLSKIDELHYWDVRAVELVSPPISAPRSYSSSSILIDPTSVLIGNYLRHLSRKRSPALQMLELSPIAPTKYNQRPLPEDHISRPVQDPKINHQGKDGKFGSFKTLTTEECGFHIHVGIDPKLDKTSELACSIPLPVLQQIAMLELRFEPVFAQLHSPSRRGGAKWCLSNAIAFLTDEHTCKKQRLMPVDDIGAFVFHPDMTAQELAWRMGCDESIRDDPKARSSRNGDRRQTDAVEQGGERVGTRSRERLNERMYCASDTSDEHDSGCAMSRIFDSDGGDRYRIVNWSNLCRGKYEGPQTLEFRQADGTLDERDVVHWVHLVSAVVRTCERLSASSDPQGCWVGWEEAAPTLSELFNLLQIDDVAVRRYWEQRVKRYADCVDKYTPELKDWEVCAVCALHHDSRLQGRRKRAELTKGYRHTGHLKRKQKSSAKQRQRDKSRRTIGRMSLAGIGADDATGMWGDELPRAECGVQCDLPEDWNAQMEVHRPLGWY